jgi:hypothetical protein
VTNLLQLPQYFDLEIYTTGRLEKVKCFLWIKDFEEKMLVYSSHDTVGL